MIKNVLIIDDSSYKLDTIKEHVEALLDDPTVITRNCIGAGLHVTHDMYDDIRKNPKEWLIITDMQMPFYEHERIERDGGLRILDELDRRDFECPVIIASSEEIEDRIASRHYAHYIGSVKESPSLWTRPAYERLIESCQE